LFLKARGQRIEIAKAGRHPGNYQITMLDFFRFLQNAFSGMLNVFKSLSNSLISQCEDGVFGMIQNVLRLIFFFQSFYSDLFGSLNQLTKQRFSTYNLSIGSNRSYVRESVG